MFAWLILPWLIASTPPVAEKGVWLLQNTGWLREETALLYALRIYTRDLKIPITISMVPSRGETLEEQREGARTRCALDAALVAWFSGDKAAPELFVLGCASEEEHRLPLLPAKDRDLAAQTLALKIRGLLTEATSAEANNDHTFPVAGQPSWTQPGEWASEVELKGADAEFVGAGQAASLPLRPESIVAGTLKKAQEPGEPGKRKRAVEGGLEWAFGMPHAFSGLHHGLLFRLAVVPSRLPLALEMDAALMTSVAGKVAGYQLTVSEIPVGVALSARLSGPSWTVSIGPRVSLHRVQAYAVSPDGRSGSATNFSAGLGAIERVLYNVSETASFVLSLSNEAIVPGQRFTMDGQNRLDVGRFQWTLSAGVVVRP